MSPTADGGRREDDDEQDCEESSEVNYLQTSIGTGPPQMAEFIFENKWTSGPLK